MHDTLLLTTPSRPRGRTIAATAGAAVLGASVLLPAQGVAAQGAWDPVATLATDGVDAPVALTTARDGGVTAVWVAGGTPLRLRTAQLPAGAKTWTTPTTITEIDRAGTSWVVLEGLHARPDGSVVVLWTEAGASWKALRSATRGAPTSTWQAPVALSADTAAGVMNLDVAVGRNGAVAAQWQERDSAAVYSSHVAVLAAGSAAWSHLPAPAELVAPSATRIGVGPSGTVALVWSDKSRRLRVSERPMNGAAWTTSPPLTSDATDDPTDFHPQYRDDGSLTVAFTGWTAEVGDSQVSTISRRAGSTAWELQRVSDGHDRQDDYAIYSLDAVALTDGTEVVAWSVDYDSGSKVDSVHTSHRTAGGAWSAPRTVSGAAEASTPSLSAGGTAVTVAWRRFDVGNTAVEASTWSAASRSWTSPTSVSSAVAYRQHLAVSVAPDGRATTLWTTSTDAVQTTSTALPAPVAVGKPTVTGTARVGATLACRPATSWVHAASRGGHVWTRNGAALTTAATPYRLRAADLGTKVACRTSATNASGTTTVTSAVVTVKVGTIKALTKPKVTGKAKVGKKLKASKGTWSVTGTKAGYQWYRGTKAIKGKAARKATYKVVAKDKGKKLRVKVTVTAQGYQSASATSKTKKIK